MDQLVVERSTWIDAPRERVWEAITDPKHLAGWLLPPALGAQMKRDARDTLYVCMGPMEMPLARLEGLEAPRVASMRGLPDEVLLATCRLEEDANGTRVTVTMTGFEALPEDARLARLAPTGTAWEKALANLKAHIAGEEVPHPEGHAAGLFGYRREVDGAFAVERSIWINASIERVWGAITDPAQIEQWFSPGTPWGLTALEPGGRLFVIDPESGGESYPSVIERVEPPHCFVTRSLPESSEPSYTTTHTLREEAGGTRLTVTHSGYEGAADEERRVRMEQDSAGFGLMVANVKALLEGEPLPLPGGF